MIISDKLNIHKKPIFARETQWKPKICLLLILNLDVCDFKANLSFHLNFSFTLQDAI